MFSALYMMYNIYFMSISDPKLRLCAVVKLKRNEVSKEHSKSGHSTVGKDVYNLPSSSGNSICQSFESFSFIKTFSSHHSFEREKTNYCLLELQAHDSVADFSEDLLQPQLPNHFTLKNVNKFTNSQSVNNMVHELPK
jgi:hypothetical protein